MLNSSITRNKLLKLALFGFVLTVPYAIKINSLFVVLTAVLWLSQLTLLQDLREALKQRAFVLIFIFYGLYISSLLFSSNTKAALSEIELKATLLILPLAFTAARLSREDCNNYLKAFVATIIIASAISIGMVTYKVFVLDEYRTAGKFLNVDWVLFSYHIPKQIDFHSPYFGMHAAMATLIAAYFFAIYAFKKNRLSTSLPYGLAMLYLLGFSVILSSRTALFASLLLLTSGAVAYLLFNRKFLIAGVALAAIVGGSALVINSTPYLKQKLSNNTGIDQRQQMWTGSFNLISDNLLFGVGSGDVKDELTKEYEKIGYAEGVLVHLDPHNQFIQLLVAFGLFGLLVFLALLGQLLYFSLTHKIYLLTAFTILIMLCSLTESILGTQKGLVFFSFFTALFVSPKKNLTPKVYS